MGQITTHILDTAKGDPAADVNVCLYREKPANTPGWEKLGCGKTNQDGRAENLIADGVMLRPGTYRLRFETQSYFDTHEQKAFYPFVDVVFRVADGAQRHHIPLLLNRFGYTTYRGS